MTRSSFRTTENNDDTQVFDVILYGGHNETNKQKKIFGSYFLLPSSRIHVLTALSKLQEVAANTNGDDEAEETSPARQTPRGTIGLHRASPNAIPSLNNPKLAVTSFVRL